jgi:hypothetical protein
VNRCGQCKRCLGEGPDPVPHVPCPDCGSTVRLYEEHCVESLRFYDSLGFKQRRLGDHGFVAKGTGGIVRGRGTGRLERKETLLDKEKDRYFEHVEDLETGQVLRHEDHKLTEHTGHGSAKFTGGKKKGG